MLFWIICAALACLLAALFSLALLRKESDAEHPAAYDLRIYRDQLKEVDRDLARGVLSDAEADRIRAEVGRRVLAADALLQKAASSGDQPRGLTLALAALVGLAVLGGGYTLYTQLGAPGQADLPRAARLAAAQDAYENRPSQAAFVAAQPPRPTPEPPADYAELIERLRDAVENRPDDIQGHVFLAQNEARLGNWDAARTAQQTVIRLKGDAAGPGDHLTLAQMHITEAGGYVSPEAEAALRAALNLDADYGPAHFFLGQLWLQNDRPDRAFRLWSALLEKGPEDAPWIAPVRASIEDVAWLAGVDYTPPEPGTSLRGPTAEDVENAGDLTPTERMDMIRGMVEGLSERLATEGGTPEEWARLISSLGALGEDSRALAIWREAQQRFADRPDALETVRRGAQRAGVDQ